MKLTVGFLIALFCSLNAWGNSSPHLHLDLELSGHEYRSLLKDKRKLRSFAASPLKEVIRMGERNLDLFAHINSLRAPNQQLELSNEATQNGYPIEAPVINNPQIIQDGVAELKKVTPNEVYDVLFNGASFPKSLTLSDDDYLKIAREADRLYQRASRWLLQEPWLSVYESRAETDVRGFYYVEFHPKRDEFLNQFTTLSPTDQQNWKQWLVGICVNNGERRSSCESSFDNSVKKNGSAMNFYQRYIGQARKLWNSYFDIQGARRDITWSAKNPDLLTIPFLNPNSNSVLYWLENNIEDEWSWKSWQLQLNFVSSGSAPFVVFEPGATPNVSGPSRNKITMDANRDIEEYSSRWTIRHEFGHVLGFPDCYVEFYDRTIKAMVSYQIDIDNLMCSRRGKLQERHFEELKKHYYVP